MEKKYEDTFGFEIRGLKMSITKEEKIKSLEEHLALLEGLTNEGISDIQKRIAVLKYT